MKQGRAVHPEIQWIASYNFRENSGRT